MSESSTKSGIRNTLSRAGGALTRFRNFTLNALFLLFLFILIVALFADETCDLVVSPALGGILIGHEVARALGRRFVFTERQGGVMTIRRGFAIDKGEKVIIAEDVVTRGTSLLEVRDVVEAQGGRVVGLTSIVDRTAGDVDLPLPLRALARVSAESWEPDACPLCAEGLAVVKPGSRGN